MLKPFAAFLILALLAGCAGTRKSGGAAVTASRAESGGTPPAFALPGVPMKSELADWPGEEKKPEAPAEPPAEARTEAPEPAEAKPAEAAPAEDGPAVKPSVPAAVPNGDLDYHLAAAKKYSARKKYRSAAAEYGAALDFLPAGDAGAVRLLERQGAMLLRAGNETGAREHFLAAIGKAKELKTSGKDLADSHLGLAYCLEKEKKIPEAIANYEKARVLSGSKTVKARISRTINELKNLPKQAGSRGDRSREKR